MSFCQSSPCCAEVLIEQKSREAATCRRADGDDERGSKGVPVPGTRVRGKAKHRMTDLSFVVS